MTNQPILCDCGEPATKQRWGVDFCQKCFNATDLEEGFGDAGDEGYDVRAEDGREQFLSIFPGGRA